MTPRALRALRAVCDTLVPHGGPDLLASVAARLASLPSRGDRLTLAALLHLLDHPAFILLLSGTPRGFSALPPARRERLLRAWAVSRLPPARAAFQALKRLTTMAHYTAVDASGRNPAWAALGYPGPIAPAPARPAQLATFAPPHDGDLDCDVVVIGSGAGGGVVAGELAAAGRDVLVIEKGGHWEAADFSGREAEMLDRLYDAAGMRTTRDGGLVVLQGSCVGGGTVVNYSTSFAPPAPLRAEWARGHRLPQFESAAFDRHIAAVTARLGVNTGHSAPSLRDQVLERGLAALDWHRAPLPRDVRACPQDDRCGYCGYGCPHEAKQSTLVTYLRDAAAHGARIVPRADARRITFARGRASGVEVVLDAGRRVRVHARTVVVAAGAVHSPALLLRSGLRHPALGRHLTLHPATAVFGLMDEPVRPWTGTLQARYSDQFADLDAGYGFRFETVPVHPSLFALAVPWESGAQHQERMAQLARTGLVGVLLRDRDGGRVRVDRHGDPRLAYRLSRYDGAHLREGLIRAAEVLEAAGAREIWTPAARWLAYRPAGPAARAAWVARLDAEGYAPNRLLLVTFHQMGSCRMGVARARAVINPEHEVWGAPGVFVADASAFPSASGVNPMLTIMAMAHRAAAIIAAR